jgi:hypothetical protein
MENKRGQIEVTFNWVYILIAGAVILLFFVGIVMKQKTVSEDRLSEDVVRIVESIFTAATVSEKTKNFIGVSGISEYTLYFDCENDVGEYGLVGKGGRVEESITPLFSPQNIKTSQLITWSLPYRMPYKVMDFLYVTSINTKYLFLAPNLQIADNIFVREFMNVTEGFNVERISEYEYQDLDPESMYQIRIIDSGVGLIRDNGPVPEKLQKMEDDKVTAISFVTPGQVNFYNKEGIRWELLNRNPVPIISLGGERDAAKYGAVFSDDDESYLCNMNKAFHRLKYINQIYGGLDIGNGIAGGKLMDMIQFYESQPEILSRKQSCISDIKTASSSLSIALSQHQSNVLACLRSINCLDLIESAQNIAEVNERLRLNCLTLY